MTGYQSLEALTKRDAECDAACVVLVATALLVGSAVLALVLL